MPLASLRRLSLAELDAPTLERLINEGEHLFVERKRQLPDPPKFGASVSAFANTLGGWLLLGVDDDKNVRGYEPPAGADLQSHLAAVLRREADPLPPFVAEMREHEDKPVGVVRVFESTDSPHIVRGTGAIYLRTSQGKEPVAIDDHRTLLELARRGEKAEERARRRLWQEPLIQDALLAPDVPPQRIARGGDAENIVVIVRAAPLTVTPQLAEVPISVAGADWALDAVTHLADRAGQVAASQGNQSVHAEPHARGVVARRVALQPLPQHRYWGSILVADSAGVIGASLKRPAMGVADLHVLRRENIRPLIDILAMTLERWEAIGRTATDLWLSLPGDVTVTKVPGPRKRAPERPHEIHVAGELTIPADDDERHQLGLRWERELARNFGGHRWEGEDPHPDSAD